MNKLSILSVVAAGLLTLTACDSDRDSNPTLQIPESFVLNTPALADNTYDLENSRTLRLTCSQPDYGYTAPATYSVQVALNSDMSGNVELPTAYSKVVMDVDAQELAVAATNMLLENGRTEQDFPIVQPLYVRLKSSLGNGVGEVFSNIIELKSTRIAFALPPVQLPEKIYFVGGFAEWDWAKSLEAVPVNGTDNTFWHLVFIDSKEKGGIKINSKQAWNGDEVGFDKVDIKDEANAGVKSDGGNISVEKTGWYLAVVRTSVAGRDVKYSLTLQEPNVYLMGDVIGGWDESAEKAKFSVPETAGGEFVSPAFEAESGDGGVRVYVKIEPYDWWKSEFMVFDKKIVYRGTGGDQDRVSGTKGQKVYLNFLNETGYIK